MRKILFFSLLAISINCTTAQNKVKHKHERRATTSPFKQIPQRSARTYKTLTPLQSQGSGHLHHRVWDGDMYCNLYCGCQKGFCHRIKIAQFLLF